MFAAKCRSNLTARLTQLNRKSIRFITNFAPLKDVRIIDLTRIVAGPFCTQILADLGASVIKIEKPNTGDEARKWGPPFVSTESCYFLGLNRNKHSICIDIKSQRGQQIIHDLARKSDVLIENYVPGNLDALNLGYECLKEIAPHLIYCSITGYGSEGPYAKKPGYDVIAASRGGLLHITGPENGEPIKPGVAVTDIATGLYAHGAIMAALLEKSKTGLGTKIDVNLLSTQLASLINIGSNYLNAGKEAKKWGTAHESIVPYEAFPTKDGFLTVGTGSDAQFKNLCRRMNLSYLYKDPKYSNNSSRVKNRRELIEILQGEFRKKSNGEWSLLFEGADFPNGPVNTIKEAFDDVHVKSIGIVKEIEHPSAGTVRFVGPPVKFSAGETEVRLPPPMLGQHTDDILSDILQYSKNEIQELKLNKIVQ